MCLRTAESLAQNLMRTANRVIDNTADVGQDAIDTRAPPTASEVASIVDQGVIDAGTAAFQDAMTLFTDDTNWGEAVAIDDGADPRWFGYGESKETGSETVLGGGRDLDGFDGAFGLETSEILNEAAAKFRTFGHADPDGLSGSSGAETEIGLHARTAAGELLGHELREQDAFLGARARAVAEIGCLGVRAGAEALVGASFQGRAGDASTDTEDPWWFGEYSADAAVAGSVIGEIDIMSADLYAGVRAGLDLRGRAQRHDLLYEGLGVVTKSELNAIVGGVAEARGSVDPLTGVSGGAEAYAGLKVGLEQGFAAAYEGTEIIGGFVQAEGWMGVGAKIEGELGHDAETDTYRLEGEAGAAIGVGASAGGGVSIAGKDFGKMFEVIDSSGAT